MRVSEKKRLALVLSGGGIKAAAFHLGVCLALREKGFKFAGGSPTDVRLQYSDSKMTFKVYVGSSAGSVISTFLAAGYEIEAIIDAFERGSSSAMNKLLKRRPDHNKLRPMTYRDIFSINGNNFVNFVPGIFRGRSLVSGGIEALLKSGFKINGLFTMKGLERYMREDVLDDNNFASLGVDLFIVATQLNHSRKVIFGNFPETTKTKTIGYANYAGISEAVAASASLPPVFAPYGIENEKGHELYFFDGEIRDTLSTHVAADHGADLIIASYSIQPYHFNPVMGSLHNYGIPVIFNQALYQVVQQKIERHIEHEQQITAIVNAVDGYFKSEGLPSEHREKLLDIIIKRANYKPGVDYLYIHPSPEDHEMFFADHFSLNSEILAQILQIGFRAALQTLRKLDM
jgi:predicted acylesterase/phospholipase RssA